MKIIHKQPVTAHTQPEGGLSKLCGMKHMSLLQIHKLLSPQTTPI